LACSPETRYRVLSFFIDGVPEPGASGGAEGEGVATGGPEGESAPGGPPGAAVAVRRPVIPHPPYRDNRCGSCHDQDSGQLFSTPQEGLCRSCHTGVPGSLRYLHGPVAVSDCLICHHPHGSPHAHLLLDEPTALCYRCHDHESVAAGAHHAAMGNLPCTECHQAHGGDDRFFLKRREP